MEASDTGPGCFHDSARTLLSASSAQSEGWRTGATPAATNEERRRRRKSSDVVGDGDDSDNSDGGGGDGKRKLKWAFPNFDDDDCDYDD
mmetsp:Transcript_11675/g.23584  ORF Transcript_11675/g.23584 Transcript_11675/m.23584 type:complete len:89 (-) Transcript_11675:76-342(-)